MSNEETSAISWPCDFTCIIVNENIISPNHYNIRLGIDPISTAKDSISVGFQKLKYLLEEQLSNSIIINDSNELFKHFENLENNLVAVPCEPYDFYVGSILLAKFMSVTEKYFDIVYMNIDSAAGDRIQYTLWDPCDCDLDLHGSDKWWNNDTVSTNNIRNITWKELNLKEGSLFEPVIIKGGLSENR